MNREKEKNLEGQETDELKDRLSFLTRRIDADCLEAHYIRRLLQKRREGAAGQQTLDDFIGE